MRVVDRRELRELSRLRLREAKALLSLKLFDGAYYLAGYAVECALKACIAKSTKRHEFPEKEKVNASYKHDLPVLVRVAGLEDDRIEQAGKDAEFERNWETVKTWSEQSRYRRHPAGSAQELVEAVGHPRHGVISWIKLHW